ncbi:DUF4255 domain-containing protein [Hymenobacter pini]|uniref:DUF4255 domain-containing protein n=1 Tax=Hymenobacter pini TaxID=2880879 RepID=UPI001CF180D5|nr:DUF4255 domain-containing protein [Hymenobacter pini]MCA8829724.1 DUF4255 domain-containing protein [Hymenobacter pini]
MIQQALQALTDELNSYLNQVFHLTDNQDRALLTPYTGPDGNSLPTTLNRLCITLVNLEQETTLRNGPAGRATPGTNGPEYARSNPAIRLNLRVLLAANFSDYSEALKFLGAGLTFFQRKNVLTAQNTPTLDRRLEKVLVELETATTHEWSQLWGMLGSKYLPGVLYKVRMLTLQDDADGATLPGIGAIDQYAG